MRWPCRRHGTPRGGDDGHVEPEFGAGEARAEPERAARYALRRPHSASPQAGRLLSPSSFGQASVYQRADSVIPMRCSVPSLAGSTREPSPSSRSYRLASTSRPNARPVSFSSASLHPSVVSRLVPVSPSPSFGVPVQRSSSTPNPYSSLPSSAFAVWGRRSASIPPEVCASTVCTIDSDAPRPDPGAGSHAPQQSAVPPPFGYYRQAVLPQGSPRGDCGCGHPPEGGAAPVSELDRKTGGESAHEARRHETCRDSGGSGR